MLKYELKKLYLKQYAVFLLIIVLFAETFFLSFAYREKEFANENDKENYYALMSVMKGKLDEDKEKYMTDEYEAVLDAEKRLSDIQKNLFSGGYADENEYLADYLEVQPYILKADAVKAVYSQYRYAAKDTEKRYMLSCGSGFCRDYPDFIFLIFVIYSSAVLFLTEESTNMIVQIRACESRNNHTFFAKLTALGILIISSQLVISLCEEVFFFGDVGLDAAGYPLQSIEYFGGCKYSLTIWEGYVLVQLMKLLGYFFVSMLTIAASLIFKKPAPAVTLPCSVCLLQQFVFKEEYMGYYLPTGLLRAVGYLRGDAYETKTEFGTPVTVKTFSEIPRNVFAEVIISVIFFAVVTILIGSRYYKKRMRNIGALAAVMLIPLVLSGCGENADVDIYYNMRNSAGFAESGDYYFTSPTEVTENNEVICGFEAVRKSDGESFDVIRSVFDDGIRADSYCTAGDSLYFMQSIGSNGFDIYEISLDDFGMKSAAGQSSEISYDFLGLAYKDTIKLDKKILKFFTDGDTLFLVTDSAEVYRCDFALNNCRCIISDGIYMNNLVYDGERIYYINYKLELKEYIIASEESRVIAGDFVKSADVCGEEVYYSNRNGIFKLSADGTSEKLSDLEADRISAKNGTVVFSEDDKLYRLTDGKAEEIYSGSLLCFGLFSDVCSVFCIAAEKKGLDSFVVQLS